MGHYDLSGKTVLVTGAEVGIGRAIALRALADGANVAIAGINSKMRDETIALVHDAGFVDRFLALSADIRDVDQVQNMFE